MGLVGVSMAAIFSGARACGRRARARWGQVRDPIPEPMAVKLAKGPTVDVGIQILVGEG